MDQTNLRNIVKNTFYIVFNNPISIKCYRREIEERSKLPLTATTSLVKNINAFSHFTDELDRSNDYYGHATILKKYCQLPSDYQLKLVIDHGMTLSEKTTQVGTDPTIISAITFGKLQQTKLLKYKPHIFPIGPYIHYAQTLLSDEELKKEKFKIGSCLLVFPSHSTSAVEVDYNFSKFVNEIKKMSENFQTTRICLYWKDVLRGFDKYYQEAGFECVTAGHVYDPNFLARLKSIIKTADITLSNGVGTHLGYCVYMNKPHVIRWSSLEIGGQKSEAKIVNDEVSSESYQQLLKIFQKPSNKISDKQRRLVSFLWGFDQIKTKEQLKKIIERTEKIYKK